MNFAPTSSLPAGEFGWRSSAARERIDVIPLVLLFGPIGIYLVSLFVVRPVPVSYLSPVLLIFTPLLVRASRRQIVGMIGRLRLEFFLLAVMAVLSVLSILNSIEPVRTLRIIFPSLLPFALFGSLVVIATRSRVALLMIPRVLLVAAFFACVVPHFLSFYLPGLREHVMWLLYRYRGFFENPLQAAIALGAITPVLVGECVLARRWWKKLLLGVGALLFLYTIFRTGSKFAMFLSFAGCLFTYVILKIRAQSFLMTGIMAMLFVFGGFVVSSHGLAIAEALDPEIGAKLRSIAEGGVAGYQSIESRKLLWLEAIEQGKAHWIIGSGAGEEVLGLTHAHNLVLDYFKGIGVFGALAVLVLCLTILFRMLTSTLYVLNGHGDDDDKRIWVLYVGAVVYMLANQLSDSFGPTTIGFLWVGYLCAVLGERRVTARRRWVPVAATRPIKF
ncbi:MAG: O-antigen ligase family protein [Verrucomicrobiota bacterium]